MKQCRTCQTEIYRRNKSGLCKSCIPHDREMQLKKIEAAKQAYKLRPELLEAASARLRVATATPEHAERARRLMTDGKLWVKGTQARGPSGSPSNRKLARSLSETRMSHIPGELRDEYRHLVYSKRFHAADAARIILDQHAHDMARFSASIAISVAAPAVKEAPVIELAEHHALPADSMKATAALLDLSVEAILSGSRTQPLVDARAVVSVAMRANGMSFPAIGRRLGRDHTSIINLVQSFDKRSALRPHLRAAVDRIARAAA